MKSKKKYNYTRDEDENILKYITSRNKFLYVTGNELWEEMYIRQITKHTAQSMRTHFLKKILKNLSDYSFLSESDFKKFATNITTYDIPYNHQINQQKKPNRQMDDLDDDIKVPATNSEDLNESYNFFDTPNTRETLKELESWDNYSHCDSLPDTSSLNHDIVPLCNTLDQMISERSHGVQLNHQFKASQVQVVSADEPAVQDVNNNVIYGNNNNPPKLDDNGSQSHVNEQNGGVSLQGKTKREFKNSSYFTRSSTSSQGVHRGVGSVLELKLYRESIDTCKPPDGMVINRRSLLNTTFSRPNNNDCNIGNNNLDYYLTLKEQSVVPVTSSTADATTCSSHRKFKETDGVEDGFYSCHSFMTETSNKRGAVVIPRGSSGGEEGDQHEYLTVTKKIDVLKHEQDRIEESPLPKSTETMLPEIYSEDSISYSSCVTPPTRESPQINLNSFCGEEGVVSSPSINSDENYMTPTFLLPPCHPNQNVQNKHYSQGSGFVSKSSSISISYDTQIIQMCFPELNKHMDSRKSTQNLRPKKYHLIKNFCRRNGISNKDLLKYLRII